MPDVLLTFEDLHAGDIVNGQYYSDGVTISSGNSATPPMVFDTENPTGGDWDLQTSNLGNVLILSEDGDSNDPDDNAGGGTFIFEFDKPSEIVNFRALDVEEGGYVRLYNEAGQLIKTVQIPCTSNNGQVTVNVYADGVSRMEVELCGSGAIDNICYVTPEIVDELDGIVEGSAGADVIDAAYDGDPEGDMIDANDEILPGEGPNDDIVDAFGGNDIITSGEGNDEVYAGSGDDTVDGGAGDDIIYGDSNFQGGAEQDYFEEHAQDISNVVVYFDRDGDGEIDYSVKIDGFPDGGTSTWISNDLDDYYGQLVDYIESENPDLVGTAVVVGASIKGGIQPTEFYAVNGNTNGSEPDIGPTLNTGPGNDEEYDYSDFYATYDPAIGSGGGVVDDGPDGDDVLNGGDGDDTIYGEGGNDRLYGDAGDDTLTGGEGADTILGGSGRDTILGGNDGDNVDGGTTGDDYDVLDLTGEGPFRVVNETVDADGDSTSGTVEFLDNNGNVTGSLQFAEIEKIIGDLVNQGPDANDDTANVDEDDSVTINVLSNDTDPDGDDLTVTDATSPDGDVVINPDGTITFTPAENFNGDTTIIYTITDGNGGEDTATVNVTVNAVNDDPVAIDDSYTTDEDTEITVSPLENDSDVDGDTVTITEITQPSNGIAVLNADGTITYTPNDDFAGEDTITYTVSDGNGGSDTATITFTVSGVNDGPDAVDDETSTNNLTPVVIPVLANDTDPENDVLTVTEASVDVGNVIINADGTLEYTPEAGFGGVATITYTITDGNGGFDTATVTVNVNDGIVEGTAGDDLIDVNYMGDPEGDMIDNNDEFLPGEGPQDDIVLAGAGDDTVLAGEGDDEVYGEDGNDTLRGEDGDDYISGGEGDDDISGGAGDDTIDAGDGNDTVLGGSGDDVIDLGEGDDVVTAGSGDDTVTGGLGNDYITTNDGNDIVEGGDGDDVINTSGHSPLPDLGYPGLFPSDPNPNNDLDFVDGGAGDDTITTGDDADTIFGGTGNDTIDGGIDNDTIDGGEGNDRIVGGEGSDVINAGDGDDIVYAGIDPALGLPDNLDIADVDGDLVTNNGMDLVNGGDGNDTIFGADDDDTLNGDAGNDYIDGGVDDDTITGGTGNDTIIGGQGADTMSGGDDRDTFIIGSAEDGIGDVIDGGTGGDDVDVLNLTGLGPLRIVGETVDADGDSTSGTVEFLDGANGNVIGSLQFTEIENIVPCFTPGTSIATPRGEILVEDLMVGDKIITRDNGIQEIRWIGAKRMDGRVLQNNPHLQPVLIQKGSLGNGLPERDMLVSPNHRMLVNNDRVALYFEENEVLVSAKHLVNPSEGVQTIASMGTTYIHFMFDNHEVVLSNGAWTESFQPGDYSLKGIGNAQRNEIFELFPELQGEAGREAYASARLTLKKHEAKLLFK